MPRAKKQPAPPPPADEELEDELETEVVDEGATGEEEVVETTEADAEAAETEIAEPVAEEVAPPSWREQLGPEYAQLSDEQAIAQLQVATRQAQQAQQLHYLIGQREAELNAMRQQQQAVQWQQQQEQAKQAEAKKRVVPEWNPAWVNQLTQDEHGKVALVPGADPTILTKIRAYQDWKEKEQTAFLNDPHAYVWGGIQDQVQSIVAQQTQQALQRHQEDQFVADFDRQNADWLWTGQVNPQGQPVPTQIGQAFIAQTTYLMQRGLPKSQAVALAKEAVKGQVAQAELAKVHGSMTAQQQAEAAKAKATAANAQKKHDLLARGANKSGNRSGTFPRPETRGSVPQNGRLNFRELAIDAAKDAGIWEEPVRFN